MLFFHSRVNGTLQRAIRAAVAAHRPEALQALLASHGAKVFARALSTLSIRAVADALSMLVITDRLRVQVQLTRATRKSLEALYRKDAQAASCQAQIFNLFSGV